MMKTATVYSAIVDVLIEQPKAWTVAQLHQELVYHVFGIEVSEQDVRRAVALLPTECITRKNRRLSIQARGFVRTLELVSVIERADEGLHIPLMLSERRRHELRHTLVLSNDWALHKSFEWARDGGALEYSSGYGSLFVRVRH
jgi:hypothetical protein